MSSNLESVFPIAAIIVSLWQEFPDFGKLFIYHLYKECPYLLPIFFGQFEGQSEIEFSKLIGYRYGDDNIVEKQDVYLKRLTGYSRLYSAILITNSRRHKQQNHLNPFNLENGWRLLINLLNLEPLPDVCPTIIYELLQITGWRMIQVYRQQFFKVLTVLQTVYFSKLNKIDNYGGPKTRLETFLSMIVKEGRILPPKGMLHPNFW